MAHLYRTAFACFTLLLSCNLSAQFWDFRPTAVCESSINVAVGNDCRATITPEMIDAGSSSIINPMSLTVSPSNLGLGTHTVRLSASNAFGARFCQTQVTVEDKQAPTAVCNAYINITLDDPTSLPNALTANIVDAGSYDNCGTIAQRWVTVDGLTYYGSTTATLTVVDASGNENNCWATITVRSPHYSGGVCAAEGNTGYEYINTFTWSSPVENFVVYSGDNDGNVFFTRERTVRAGDAVTLTYSPGYVYGSYREYWRVYLDLNRDGDWDDSGEMLHQWNGYGGNTATINLPASFGRYGISRMRVVMSYGGYRDACATGFYGEVEDYAVRLTSPFMFRPQAAELSYAIGDTETGYNEYGADFTPPAVALPPRAKAATDLSIYPNPALSGATVRVDLGPQTQVQSVELSSMVGQTLRRYPAAAAGPVDLQLPRNLTPGLYLLSGLSENGREWTRKLLVQ